MSKNQPARRSTVGRAIRKFSLTAFVLFSYVAYALHQRFSNPSGGTASLSPTPDGPTAQQGQVPSASPAETVPQAPPPLPAPTQLQPAAPAVPPPASPSLVPPTPTVPLAPTDTPTGLYKDGTYTGEQVDAFYGLVQVKVVIRSGKIADVQVVQYPNDRRTSVQINSIAVPYLRSEAIQAQSANVDIVSGATLTSEGFAMSLQSALTGAQN